MNAVAQRRPAPTAAVARHYLGLLARERGVSTFLLPLGVTLFGSVNEEWRFRGLATAILLAFLFPLYQWRGGGRDPLDAAMPVDTARHRRIRVACGAAWATLGLAAGGALYVGLLIAGNHGLAGYPAGYPLALLGWGVAAYLFGSAALLRARRPGPVLTLVWLTFVVALDWLPAPGPGLPQGNVPPEVARAVSGLAWAAACLLPLALGWAAVWLAALPGPSLPRMRSLLPLGHRTGPGLPVGPSPAPAAFSPTPGGPRRPASIARVLRSELAAVSHDARWALLLALPIGAMALRPEVDLSASELARLPLAGHTEMLLIFPVVAFFWPLLVWMGDRGAGREWAEAVPAGTVRRRLLRLLAGAAWLELVTLAVGAGVVAGAWRAGAVASPGDVPAALWAGFPIGVLMMYLVGSIPLLLAQSHPVRYTVVWFLAFMFLGGPLLTAAREWRFSPGAAFSVIVLNPARHWAEAVVVWLPLLAALAVATVAGGVAHDRSGASAG